MFFENLLQALSSIRANKMRSFLTMLGIIIGIAAVIAIVTLGDALQTFINANMQSMGASMIVVTVRERSEEEESLFSLSMGPANTSALTPTENDLLSSKDIAQLSTVFAGRLNAIGILNMGGQNAYLQEGRRRANVSINGSNADFYKVQGITILTGRWLDDADVAAKKRVAVVSQNSAELLYGSNEKALGKEVKLHDGANIQPYVIVGVYKYESELAGMMMSAVDLPTDVYVPFSVVKMDYHLATNHSTIYVSGNLNENVQTLTDDLNRYLKPLYRHNANFEAVANNFEGQLESFNSIVGMVTMAIGIIAAISLIVGGVGVMNIMLVSVTERTREIGTRKAIGARSSSIRSQFIMESLILCGIGGALGVVLGGILGLIGSGVIGYPALPSTPSIVVSVMFSMLIGIFFGAYPAGKAAQLQPIEALRYE